MDKTEFESIGGFLKVKSAETTPYFYTERKGIDSVAFILVDENRHDTFGVTNERKPPMDERYGELAFIETAFGGSNDSIDPDEYLALSEGDKIAVLQEIVQVEAREEAGYDVELDRIKFMSKEFVSTQMNQWAYLFVVIVTDVEQGEKDPQNATEAMADVRWKTLKDVQKMNDWKAKSIIFSSMK